MKELLGSPLFGIIVSIAAYEIGLFINKKTGFAVFNPLLLSIVIIIVFLSCFHIKLDDYNNGGSIISIFLGPATVILAVPLYSKLDILKNNLKEIITGIIVGSLTSISSVLILSRLFGLNKSMMLSLIPKSITTPVGMELSKEIGGIPSITVAAIIITGIIGAIIGPTVCKIFRIKDKVAVGIAIGTSSHAIGTTKAMELGETEGAMSGLAIGISAIITVIITTVLVRFI
ncbi:MAG: LrgB family protein [Bacillota bacterium]|nr:LrgB family protein [Bacillota bacterium]